jgi:hypothetical protein
MKSILTGILVALVIAGGAALLLDSQVQRSAETAFTTTGARL